MKTENRNKKNSIQELDFKKDRAIFLNTGGGSKHTADCSTGDNEHCDSKSDSAQGSLPG